MNISQRIFLRAFLIVSCVFGASNLNAGVSTDTIVQTQDGPKPIRVLKIGDKILCSNITAPDFNIEEGVVNSIEEIETNEVVEITTSDNVTFYVAADQKLFVTHKWVEAKKLTIEDILLTKDRTVVKIMSIRHLQTPMTLRFITVDKNPNFWAAENGVLIHNGFVTGTAVYGATKASLIAACAAGTFYAVAGTGGIAIAAANGIAAGTAGIAGAAGGMTAAGAGAIIVEATAIGGPLGTAVGAGIAGLTVVAEAETVVLVTAGASGAGTAVALSAAPVAGAAITMTASIIAAIEAASIAAAAPFYAAWFLP